MTLRSLSALMIFLFGDLIDAALATLPVELVTTAPTRRRRFQVIQGGRAD
jgi:hypothetical protein